MDNGDAAAPGFGSRGIARKSPETTFALGEFAYASWLPRVFAMLQRRTIEQFSWIH